MISPRDPRRTMRKRRSAIGALANAREQITGRMMLGVADYRDADTEPLRLTAFRHRVRIVVGSLGVDVGADVLQERFDVGLIENNDEIHGGECGNKSGSASLG